MRRLPAVSVMGTAQVLLEVQVAVAPLLAPVSSTKAKDPVLALPVALFQLVLATTPALSPAPMAVPFPTKLMLTARAVVVDGVGTIWMPFRGARSVLGSEAEAGVALIVKAVA